jgi:DNA-binding GntR family transcriptional regulator
MSRPGSESTSRNLIYMDLRRSISLGHCQPGERLDPDTLAKNYGTSVTPVRDALQMLGQEGLVTIKPRSGYFVTRITLKQLRDMLELREILELAAIERAAARISEAQLEELKHVHAGYTGDDDESSDRYASENKRFHYLIARASGNQELAEMLSRLHDRLARYMVLVSTSEMLEHGHARLIEALRSRDPAKARQVMTDELNQTREKTMERVIQEQGDYWRLGVQSEKEG